MVTRLIIMAGWLTVVIGRLAVMAARLLATMVTTVTMVTTLVNTVTLSALALCPSVPVVSLDARLYTTARGCTRGVTSCKVSAVSVAESRVSKVSAVSVTESRVSLVPQ